jgi:hypothetical protein
MEIPFYLICKNSIELTYSLYTQSTENALQKTVTVISFLQYHSQGCIFFNVLSVGPLWHPQKFLKYNKYIILKFPPSIILLYPIPFPGIVSTGIIFPLAYMYI